MRQIGLRDMAREFTLQPSPKGNIGALHQPIPGGMKSLAYLPEMTFAGDSTGFTYSDRYGVVTKIGIRVTFEFFVILTAKGSATGTVDIFGPGFPLVNVAAPCTVYWKNLGSNFVHVGGLLQTSNGLTFVRLLGIAAAAASLAELADTNIANNTEMSVAGSYTTTENGAYV